VLCPRSTGTTIVEDSLPCCSRPPFVQPRGPWPWRRWWTQEFPGAVGGSGWARVTFSQGQHPAGWAAPACIHVQELVPGSAPRTRLFWLEDPGVHLWYQGHLLMASEVGQSSGGELEAPGGQRGWQLRQNPWTRPVQRVCAQSQPWPPGSATSQVLPWCCPPWER
jgi:hypothetical protein